MGILTNQVSRKVLISIITLFILIIYYSTFRHPYDVKLALTHHFYYKPNIQFNIYNNLQPIKNHTLIKTNKTKFINNNKQNYSSSNLHDVLNITNIPINQSIQHFQLVQLKTNNNNCPYLTKDFQQSFLLIYTNAKTIGLKYMKLIKNLIYQSKTTSNQQNSSKINCINFRIFLLKQNKFLNLDYESQTDKYINEIFRAVKTVNQLTKKKLSIMTSEQGCALLMKTFLAMIDLGGLKGQMAVKIDKILMINMYNGKMVDNQPISQYLDEVKREIITQKQKLKLFNWLNFIFINTNEKHYRLLGHMAAANSQNMQNEDLTLTNSHKQGNFQSMTNKGILSENYFIFEKDQHYSINKQQGIQLIQKNTDFIEQLFDDTILSKKQIKLPPQKQQNTHKKSFSNYLMLKNATIIHTMEMTNIHASFIEGDYFHFVPFLQLISNFIIQNSRSSMSLKATQLYFRFGETQNKLSLQSSNEIDLSSCILYNINTTEPVSWSFNKKCVRLSLSTSIQNPVYLIYSTQGQFHIYTDSMDVIQPFDKQLNRSLYFFDKFSQSIIVSNPDGVNIVLTVSQILTPSNPLTKMFSTSQILYMSQLEPYGSQDNRNKKFVIRSCQGGNLFVFPDNFPIGKISRQFLLQQSDRQCYNSESRYNKFMDKLTQNWILLRNIIILVLFKKFFFQYKSTFKGIISTFLSVSVLLYYTQLSGYHTVFIMFAVYVIDQGMQLLCQISQYIQMDHKKVFLSMIILFIVSYICQYFLFQQYNHWKMLLIFVIFFLNQDNTLIVAVKLYYLQDAIIYGEQNLAQIIQLAFFLYMTRTPKNKKQPTFYFVWWYIKLCFLIGLWCFFIFNAQTNSFQLIFNYYMKIAMLMKFLNIFMLSKGLKEQIDLF